MPQLYQSAEDLNSEAVMETVLAATKAGLIQQVVDEGHVFCARPDSMELVDVFPDGSWEYQNALEDGDMVTMSGANAMLLAMYLSSDENKALFEKEQGGE
jgi:hypothetical protein